MHPAFALFLVLSAAAVLANQDLPSRTKRLCSCSQLKANPCSCQSGPRARCSCVKPPVQRSCPCPARSQFSQCRDSCRRKCNLDCVRSKLTPSCPSSCASSCSRSCLDDLVPINVVMPKSVTPQQCVPVCKRTCGESCGDVLPVAECDQLCAQPCEQRCTQMLPIFMQEKKVTKTTIDSHVLTVSHCPPACRPDCESSCISRNLLYDGEQAVPGPVQISQDVIPKGEQFPVAPAATGPLNGPRNPATGRLPIFDSPANLLEPVPISRGKIPLPSADTPQLLPIPEPFMDANNRVVLKPSDLAMLPPNGFYPLSSDPAQIVRRPDFHAVGELGFAHTSGADQRYLRPLIDDRHKIIPWSPYTMVPQSPQLLSEHFGEPVRDGTPVFTRLPSDSLQSITGPELIATRPEIAREEMQRQLHPAIQELNHPDSNFMRGELYPLPYPSATRTSLRIPNPLDLPYPESRRGGDFYRGRAISPDKAIVSQFPRERSQSVVTSVEAMPGVFPYPNRALLMTPYKDTRGAKPSPNGAGRSLYQASQGQDAELPAGTTASDVTDFKCPVACMPTCDPQCIHEQELLARESLGRISAGMSLKTQELEKKIRELESALENANASNTTTVSRTEATHPVS